MTLPKNNHDLSYIDYLDTANLNQGSIDTLQRLHIGVDSIPSRAKRVVRDNDILFSTVRPNQLHYGFIRNSNKNLICSTGFAILSPKNNTIPYYLYKYLTQKHIIEYLQGIAETSTSTYPSIKPSDIGELEIDSPSLAEQKAIANILSSLDEKIELNNKINKTLEEIAQTLYKRWFVDFDFPNEDGEPYQSSGGEMVESELGLIPKEWKIVKLSDIAHISSGDRPKSKTAEKDIYHKFPVCGASGIMAYSDEYNLDKQAMIIGRVGTHGVVQRIYEKTWASDNTLIIDSIYYEFVYQILKGIDYKKLNRGSTQPLITQTDIKNIKISQGDEQTSIIFEIIISSLYRLKQNLDAQNSELSSIRDELLPKLMNGEIEVPVEE